MGWLAWDGLLFAVVLAQFNEKLMNYIPKINAAG